MTLDELHQYKRRQGVPVLRYAEQPVKYSAGAIEQPPNVLSPEAVAQLVAVIERLSWVKEIQAWLIRLKAQEEKDHEARQLAAQERSLAPSVSPDDLRKEDDPRSQVEKYRCKVVALRKPDPVADKYTRHQQLLAADAQYRESRRPQAEAVAKYAMQHGLDYDTARGRLGLSEPLALPTTGPIGA